MLDGRLEPLLAEAGTLAAADRRVFEDAVETLRAAVAAQQRWLDQDVVPKAHGSFRLGAKLYDVEVRYELGTAQSRPEIERRARAAIVTIRARMYTIARQVLSRQAGSLIPGRPADADEEGTIRAALTLAESKHPTRAAFGQAIKATLRETTAFVRAADLVGVPDQEAEVVDMPADMQGIVPAFYETLGERPIYAVSPIPSDWPDARAEDYLAVHNDYYLQNLTIHEAMPGHYLQATICELTLQRYAAPSAHAPSPKAGLSTVSK